MSIPSQLDNISGDTTTDEDECKCAANIFYKKYKSQIHTELEHYFMNQKFSGQKKSLIDANQIQKEREGKSPSKVFQKPKRKIKPKFSKQELELLSYDEDKKTSISVSKDKTRSFELVKISKRESKKGIEREDIIPVDKAFTESTKSSKSIKSSDIKNVLSIKGEEDTEAYLKEAEHVNFFASALDAKMHEIFGETSEQYTEKGYFQLDRFREASELTESAYKISTFSISGEEEDISKFLLPKTKDEFVSESMKKALDYLKKHKVADLFKFLGAHLVAANPCNPIDFLMNLLDNCLNYRMGYREPPLLYTPKHIESLYCSMDPMKLGYLAMHQYHTGMFTLGIKDYNLFPETLTNNNVSKQVFMTETFNQLRRQLNEMIKSFEVPCSIITTKSPIISATGGE